MNCVSNDDALIKWYPNYWIISSGLLLATKTEVVVVQSAPSPSTGAETSNVLKDGFCVLPRKLFHNLRPTENADRAMNANQRW